MFFTFVRIRGKHARAGVGECVAGRAGGEPSSAALSATAVPHQPSHRPLQPSQYQSVSKANISTFRLIKLKALII